MCPKYSRIPKFRSIYLRQDVKLHGTIGKSCALSLSLSLYLSLSPSLAAFPSLLEIALSRKPREPRHLRIPSARVRLALPRTEAEMHAYTDLNIAYLAPLRARRNKRNVEKAYGWAG